jgi:hypothetical protein
MDRPLWTQHVRGLRSLYKARPQLACTGVKYRCLPRGACAVSRAMRCGVCGVWWFLVGMTAAVQVCTFGFSLCALPFGFL